MLVETVLEDAQCVFPFALSVISCQEVQPFIDLNRGYIVTPYPGVLKPQLRSPTDELIEILAAKHIDFSPTVKPLEHQFPLGGTVDLKDLRVALRLGLE